MTKYKKPYGLTVLQYYKIGIKILHSMTRKKFNYPPLGNPMAAVLTLQARRENVFVFITAWCEGKDAQQLHGYMDESHGKCPRRSASVVLGGDTWKEIQPFSGDGRPNLRQPLRYGIHGSSCILLFISFCISATRVSVPLHDAVMCLVHVYGWGGGNVGVFMVI